MKIIAESAYNHNGSLEYLKNLASSAKNAGADYFTVQIMDVDSFCTSNYSKYNIYKDNNISFTEWTSLFEYCREIS